MPIKLNITKKEKGGGELQSDRCVNIDIGLYMHSHKPKECQFELIRLTDLRRVFALPRFISQGGQCPNGPKFHWAHNQSCWISLWARSQAHGDSISPQQLLLSLPLCLPPVIHLTGVLPFFLFNFLLPFCKWQATGESVVSIGPPLWGQTKISCQLRDGLGWNFRRINTAPRGSVRLTSVISGFFLHHEANIFGFRWNVSSTVP